jgi:hypothetical protein
LEHIRLVGWTRPDGAYVILSADAASVYPSIDDFVHGDDDKAEFIVFA